MLLVLRTLGWIACVVYSTIPLFWLMIHPRARVRHPVYLGHLCEMLAWSVGTGLVVCWLLTGFAMVTGAVMIQMEDAELEKRFGEAYAAYRERVPAVLPRLDG